MGQCLRSTICSGNKFRSYNLLLDKKKKNITNPKSQQQYLFFLALSVKCYRVGQSGRRDPSPFFSARPLISYSRAYGDRLSNDRI